MALSSSLFAWSIGQLHPLRPGFWLLLSFALGGLVWAAARFWPQARARRVWMARWLLTPYLGLVAGGLSPRLLGLSDIDWAAGLGLGVGLIFGVWLLLALIRTSLHQDAIEADSSATSPPPLWEQIIWAGAQELHWVFLRGAVWELLLVLPSPPESPGYWAVWLASLLALPELAIQHRHTSQRVIAGVLLVTTAILFFYTRNFFLCWLLHASVRLLTGAEQAGIDTTSPPGDAANPMSLSKM